MQKKKMLGVCDYISWSFHFYLGLITSGQFSIPLRNPGRSKFPEPCTKVSYNCIVVQGS